jgi:small subunit ribosomal protein S2
MSETSLQNQDVEVKPEIAEMFKAGIHFGYRRTKRHPNMRQFIFGTKNNVEVFDLPKISQKMGEALDFITTLGAEDKTILFVGTKAAAKLPIKEVADKISMPYTNERWLGGTLTNFKIIQERISFWLELERQKNAGELKKYTKQEQARLGEKIEKLEHMFGGLRSIKRLPNAMFVIDIGEELTAINEAKRRDIPVIALSNSDTNPELVEYPIPANDNSKSSIEYILNRVVAAYEQGQQMKKVSSEDNQK